MVSYILCLSPQQRARKRDLVILDLKTAGGQKSPRNLGDAMDQTASENPAFDLHAAAVALKAQMEADEAAGRKPALWTHGHGRRAKRSARRRRVLTVERIETRSNCKIYWLK
jgi:hypothetical protein